MNRIITLMLLVLISNLAVVDAHAGSEKGLRATFKVEKMTCATCPITIRTAMQRVDGVKEVTVDFDSKTATVVYDGSLTNEEHIAASSTNIGYPATPIGEKAQ
jgi:mercuric ion binding protein